MTEELIEGYLVYTDNGIEKVHWCNVNGVKELVSPKGKVYGYVPDYFEVKRLQEQLNEANEALKDVCMHAETEQFECRCGWVEPCKDCNAHYAARDYIEKWGVK